MTAGTSARAPSMAADCVVIASPPRSGRTSARVMLWGRRVGCCAGACWCSSKLVMCPSAASQRASMVFRDAVRIQTSAQCVERPSCGITQGGQEVSERGIPPRVAPEVRPDAVAERLPADGRHQLLEHRRALLVGDAVEAQFRLVRVRDAARDGMRS